MPGQPDFFRDFGISPHGLPPPPETIRCYFPWWHVAGQFAATFLMCGLGLGMAVVFAVGLRFPINIFAAAVPISAFGCLVYFATRNDYLWVELDGNRLRAQHLYTRRIIVRSIEEIEDLLTLVIKVRTAAMLITEAWLGRIKGVEIRFRDKRAPFRVCRADPAMRNAKELIEAIIFRMSQRAEVDAEIIDLDGKPIIRRVFWKTW